MKIRKITRTFATTALVFVISAQAWAHTALVSSSPTEGASLETSPEAIELAFTEDVKLLRVELSQGKNEIDIDFKPVTTAAASFSVQLPELSNGTYSVSWVVLGADSHRVDDVFSFGIGVSAEKHTDHGQEHEDHAQHGSHSHTDH
jgi:methionine-rich copper-binding protein CopC